MNSDAIKELDKENLLIRDAYAECIPYVFEACRKVKRKTELQTAQEIFKNHFRERLVNLLDCLDKSTCEYAKEAATILSNIIGNYDEEKKKWCGE